MNIELKHILLYIRLIENLNIYEYDSDYSFLLLDFISSYYENEQEDDYLMNTYS